MKTRTLVMSCAALLGALLLASCNYRSEEFRYRMTVEVETPQGLRTGSSVIEVQVSDPGRGSMVLPEAGTTAKVRGEAVAVDLPNGKVLFALLRTLHDGDVAAEFPYEALKPSRYRGEYALIERTKELKRMRRVGELPRQLYPMLVTFDDLDDPKSVKLLDPDDLADSFGPGVKLDRITIQMVDDPVSFVLASRLSWLDAYVDKHFDGSSTISEGFTPDHLASRLYSGSFSTEHAQ